MRALERPQMRPSAVPCCEMCAVLPQWQCRGRQRLHHVPLQSCPFGQMPLWNEVPSGQWHGRGVSEGFDHLWSSWRQWLDLPQERVSPLDVQFVLPHRQRAGCQRLCNLFVFARQSALQMRRDLLPPRQGWHGWHVHGGRLVRTSQRPQASLPNECVPSCALHDVLSWRQ